MGKGSGRRPTTLTQDELALAWARTFNTEPHENHQTIHDDVLPLPAAEIRAQDGEDTLLEAGRRRTDVH